MKASHFQFVVSAHDIYNLSKSKMLLIIYKFKTEVLQYPYKQKQLLYIFSTDNV